MKERNAKCTMHVLSSRLIHSAWKTCDEVRLPGCNIHATACVCYPTLPFSSTEMGKDGHPPILFTRGVVPSEPFATFLPSMASRVRGLWSCSQPRDATLAGIAKAGTLMRQCPTGTSSLAIDQASQSQRQRKLHDHSEGGEEWRPLFFVLTSHSLAYYPTGRRARQGGLKDPCGDILLTSNTRVEEACASVLRVDTGFETIFLRSREPKDAKSWRDAIQSAIKQIPEIPRGYLTRVKKGWFGRARRERCFFLLHSEGITWHASHAETAVLGGFLTLTANSAVSTFGAKGVAVVDGDCAGLVAHPKRWRLIADSSNDQMRWVNAISHAIATEQAIGNLPLVPTGFTDSTLDGFLTQRNEIGAWNEHFFVLTRDALHRVEQDPLIKKTSSKKFSLTPNTRVQSTSLSVFSFEVVTFADVLHLSAASKEIKEQWMSAIWGLISSTVQYAANDKLQDASIAKDVRYYSVLFKSTNSPGLVLERRGNLALVSKVTRSLQHCVSLGSALVAINSESVVTQSYDYIVDVLNNWKPPLTLRFCSPPKKTALLQLLTPPAHGDSNRRLTAEFSNKDVSWQRLSVELKSGRLVLNRLHEDYSDAFEECISLRGAAVSLLDPKDAFHSRHCFRIMSGLLSVTLKASSCREMLDWATSLVHGISIENGGGFLLDHLKICDERLSFASASGGLSSGSLGESSTTSISDFPMQSVRPGRTVTSDSDFTLKDSKESSTIPFIMPSTNIANSGTDDQSFRSVESEEKSFRVSLLDKAFSPSDAVQQAMSADILAYSTDSSSGLLENGPLWGIDDGIQKSSNSKVDDDGFPVMDRTMLIPDEGTRQKDSMPASGWLDTTSLSEEELDEVYEDFLKSVHGVNPQKFSRFLRLMKQGSNSVGNPFDEMNLFSKFSVDGKAIFNKDDFIRGVRRLEEEDGIESSMYQNLLQHVRGTDDQFLTDLK